MYFFLVHRAEALGLTGNKLLFNDVLGRSMTYHKILLNIELKNLQVNGIAVA